MNTVTWVRRELGTKHRRIIWQHVTGAYVIRLTRTASGVTAQCWYRDRPDAAMTARVAANAFENFRALEDAHQAGRSRQNSVDPKESVLEV